VPDEFDAAHFPPPVAGKKYTSQRASQLIFPKVGTLRRRVYDVIAGAGADGATRDEIERLTGLAGSTVRPRVLELIEAGFVRETKDTRETAAGRAAYTLVAVADRREADRGEVRTGGRDIQEAGVGTPRDPGADAVCGRGDQQAGASVRPA
jgi:hypothetical protein